MPGQRVALLCYSVGLASWFKRYMTTVDRRHRPDFIGTFEDLAAYLGVTEFGGRDDPDFWETRLPQQMAELVGGAARRQEVRLVRRRRGAGLRRPLVDADHALPARRGARWHLRLQRREPAGVRPVRPARRCRWSRSCSTATSGTRARSPRPSPPWRRCGCTRAVATGPEVTFVRMRRSRRPSTSRATRSTPARRLAARGHRAADAPAPATRSRWRGRSSWGRRATGTPSGTPTRSSTVTCSASRASSGASSCCAANESSVKDRSRERLYVGLSRATDKLVVVGPPELVKEIGGPEVAKRLGIA